MASVYLAELAQAIGHGVLEEAVAEDSVAELVVLRAGVRSPDPVWWRSGESLVEALERIVIPTFSRSLT